MNFFHIPSFEDHYTLKIWLKNWNLKVNKSLFELIHHLNDLFNSVITVDLLKKEMGSQALEALFPLCKSGSENVKFQIFIKDENEDNEDFSSHFYRTMHFLVFIVQVDSDDKDSINELVNSLKKYTYLKNTKSLLTLTKSSSSIGTEKFTEFSNSILLNDFADIKNPEVKEKIVKVFIEKFKEKLLAINDLERMKVNSTFEEFVIMNKKKPANFTEAKVMKLRGDISLILNSLQDATCYYNKCKEILQIEKKNKVDKKNLDNVKLWIASVNESLAACVYFCVRKVMIESKEGMSDAMKLQLSDMIKMLNDTIQMYLADNKQVMVYELYLKMLGLFSLLKDKRGFIDVFFKLRSTMLQVSVDPRIFLYIGDLAHASGLNRIAICSLFECSRQARKIKELESISVECLNLCARIMKVDVDSYQNNFEMIDRLPSQVTLILLINLLDININNKNNERTLHYYLLLMKKFQQKENNWVYPEITQKLPWEFPFYRFEYDVLPYIQRLVPIGRSKEYRKIIEESDKQGQPGDGIFLFDPRKRSRFVDLFWVAQEEAEVLIYLTNPLSIETKIDSISIESEGVDIASYSSEVLLPPYCRNIECKFKIRPVSAGILVIKGVKIRIGNLIYMNSVDSRGVSSIYHYIKKENPYIFEQHYISNDINLKAILVAESVPCIDIELKNYVPETIYYNENLFLEFRISNFSKIRARDLKIIIRIDYENSYTINYEYELKDEGLEINRFLDVNLNIFQSKFKEKDNFDVRKKGAGLLLIDFFNRTIIERIYKVTLRFESRFEDNVEYVGSKEYLKFFKNYRLFDVRVNLIDLYTISSNDNTGDVRFRDISDEIQLFFEIDIKFSNIASQNILISLKNRETNQILSTITLIDKNIIKLVEMKSSLQNYSNLNEKYMLLWEIKDSKRNGIVNFDYPIIFPSEFDVSIKTESPLAIKSPVKMIVTGTSKEEIKSPFTFEMMIETKGNSKFLIEGDTKFIFEKDFKKEFTVFFCDADEYSIFIIIRLKEEGKAYISRKHLLVN